MEIIYHTIVEYWLLYLLFFFFNDPATTEISPLSLHDALPISSTSRIAAAPCRRHGGCARPNNRWIARATNPDSPYRNRNAITPTNGGSTAGRAMTEPRVFRPGNSSHSNKKASGTPIAAASATLATEIQTLAHSTRHSPGRQTHGASAARAPAQCTTHQIGYDPSQ